MRYLLLFPLFINPLFADIHNGKEMYKEANCKRCHSNYIYEEDRRKLKTLDELKVRVQRCADTYAGWFEEDTADVVEYLNSKFYKYEVKK